MNERMEDISIDQISLQKIVSKFSKILSVREQALSNPIFNEQTAIQISKIIDKLIQIPITKEMTPDKFQLIIQEIPELTNLINQNFFSNAITLLQGKLSSIYGSFSFLTNKDADLSEGASKILMHISSIVTELDISSSFCSTLKDNLYLLSQFIDDNQEKLFSPEKYLEIKNMIQETIPLIENLNSSKILISATKSLINSIHLKSIELPLQAHESRQIPSKPHRRFHEELLNQNLVRPRNEVNQLIEEFKNDPQSHEKISDYENRFSEALKNEFPFQVPLNIFKEIISLFSMLIIPPDFDSEPFQIIKKLFTFLSAALLYYYQLPDQISSSNEINDFKQSITNISSFLQELQQKINDGQKLLNDSEEKLINILRDTTMFFEHIVHASTTLDIINELLQTTKILLDLSPIKLQSVGIHFQQPITADSQSDKASDTENLVKINTDSLSSDNESLRNIKILRSVNMIQNNLNNLKTMEIEIYNQELKELHPISFANLISLSKKSVQSILVFLYFSLVSSNSSSDNLSFLNIFNNSLQDLDKFYFSMHISPLSGIDLRIKSLILYQQFLSTDSEDNLSILFKLYEAMFEAYFIFYHLDHIGMVPLSTATHLSYCFTMCELLNEYDPSIFHKYCMFFNNLNLFELNYSEIIKILNELKDNISEILSRWSLDEQFTQLASYQGAVNNSLMYLMKTMPNDNITTIVSQINEWLKNISNKPQNIREALVKILSLLFLIRQQHESSFDFSEFDVFENISNVLNQISIHFDIFSSLSSLHEFLQLNFNESEIKHFTSNNFTNEDNSTDQSATLNANENDVVEKQATFQREENLLVDANHSIEERKNTLNEITNHQNLEFPQDIDIISDNVSLNTENKIVNVQQILEQNNQSIVKIENNLNLESQSEVTLQTVEPTSVNSEIDNSHNNTENKSETNPDGPDNDGSSKYKLSFLNETTSLPKLSPFSFEEPSLSQEYAAIWVEFASNNCSENRFHINQINNLSPSLIRMHFIEIITNYSCTWTLDDYFAKSLKDTFSDILNEPFDCTKKGLVTFFWKYASKFNLFFLSSLPQFESLIDQLSKALSEVAPSRSRSNKNDLTHMNSQQINEINKTLHGLKSRLSLKNFKWCHEILSLYHRFSSLVNEGIITTSCVQPMLIFRKLYRMAYLIFICHRCFTFYSNSSINCEMDIASVRYILDNYFKKHSLNDGNTVILRTQIEQFLKFDIGCDVMILTSSLKTLNKTCQLIDLPYIVNLVDHDFFDFGLFFSRLPKSMSSLTSLFNSALFSSACFARKSLFDMIYSEPTDKIVGEAIAAFETFKKEIILAPFDSNVSHIDKIIDSCRQFLNINEMSINFDCINSFTSNSPQNVIPGNTIHKLKVMVYALQNKFTRLLKYYPQSFDQMFQNFIPVITAIQQIPNQYGYFNSLNQQLFEFYREWRDFCAKIQPVDFIELFCNFRRHTNDIIDAIGPSTDNDIAILRSITRLYLVGCDNQLIYKIKLVYSFIKWQLGRYTKNFIGEELPFTEVQNLFNIFMLFDEACILIKEITKKINQIKMNEQGITINLPSTFTIIVAPSEPHMNETNDKILDKQMTIEEQTSMAQMIYILSTANQEDQERLANLQILRSEVDQLIPQIEFQQNQIRKLNEVCQQLVDLTNSLCQQSSKVQKTEEEDVETVEKIKQLTSYSRLKHDVSITSKERDHLIERYNATFKLNREIDDENEFLLETLKTKTYQGKKAHEIAIVERYQSFVSNFNNINKLIQKANDQMIHICNEMKLQANKHDSQCEDVIYSELDQQREHLKQLREIVSQIHEEEPVDQIYEEGNLSNKTAAEKIEYLTGVRNNLKIEIINIKELTEKLKSLIAQRANQNKEG
ncbi:hypothetical protein TRFO_29000 [Tritrichomonas foetus]|uniref:Uncharacterized protein n=1 Tax=Tritrichomonas foetus TaxID=1144522 RepID=A0A1J4K1E4_9EUKA|nr:hypothetical protein TRFO_29000 [Tritrichomonas foetus]|eukprot:OHT03574.1 hypothetical protein TRFO_29000 [Tritrichomonas foetus]